MVKRFVVLAALLALVGGVSTDAVAKGGRARAVRLLPPKDQLHLQYDPPASHLALRNSPSALRQALLDTLWYGGNGGAGGLTELDGIWDFEDGTLRGTLQGWTSEDLTIPTIRFKRYTNADFIAHGDDQDVTMNGTGSVWVGAHQDEAEALCYPGGQGYGDGWGQYLTKGFAYDGSGSVTLEFDYFVDSEDDYDFTYVYVISTTGIQSLPLNTSDHPNSDGFGYSGSNEFLHPIGSPSAPAHQEPITISQADLGPAGTFSIRFNFDSDPLFSDQFDSVFPDFLNSWYGPLGLDDIELTGDVSDVSDFETDLDGWVPSVDPAIGAFLKVEQLAENGGPLEVGDPCGCPLVNWVMIAADLEGPYAHPKKQHEMMQSNITYTGAGSGLENRATKLIDWSMWHDTPFSNGVGLRVAMHYYPWTCPTTGAVGWTTEPAGEGGFIFSENFGGPGCDDWRADNSSFMPPGGVDSIKVAFELLGDCDDFGQSDNCTGPDDTNFSPYLDNIRIGFATAVDAPLISADLLFQDAYPQGNRLEASATANIDSYFDWNYSDQIPTNADMGDSANVTCPPAPNTEVYLNFRVKPGPALSPADPFWTKYGGNSLTGFVDARMDSSQTASGVAPGEYCTWWHEAESGGVEGTDILPDGFFTPGTSIDYFFSSKYSGGTDVWVIPDTTGGFYYEVDVLPGYREIGGELRAPCFLYVDAYNAGAQVPMEDKGFRPYFGTTTDDDGRTRDAWDRYDYLAASSNVPAPMAREASGDNGMTKYQSMIYRHVYYNTGEFAGEGLRDGDADLLVTLLINPSFNRWDFLKGLWLSGNGMARILERTGRPHCASLLTDYMTAQRTGGEIGYRVDTGDTSFCAGVKNIVGGCDIEPVGWIAALRGNGCPTLYDFVIVGPVGDGEGSLVFFNQDEGGGETQWASVCNDQIAPGNPANYRTVFESFSTHFLRTAAPGWNEWGCSTDSTVITDRVADVLTWLGASPGAECDPTEIIVGADRPSVVTPARTMLFRNAPNPFNPITSIRYQLAEKTHVKLQIFNVSGKLVRTLVDGIQTPDQYNVQWDGKSDAGADVGSGVYWARMATAAGFNGSTKMVVLK
jgi:hypothetical protein